MTGQFWRFDVPRCPDCPHAAHDRPCKVQVGGVPGFGSTGRTCDCPGTQTREDAA